MKLTVRKRPAGFFKIRVVPFATPVPAFGTLTVTAFTAEVTAATTLDAQITALEAQLTDKKNQLDSLYAGVWDRTKRIRSAVKGVYGDDSSQYEIVGGKRLSERKRPTRKAASE
jgi:hypothetical protein